MNELEDIYVRLADMPAALYGFTRENSDGSYTVIVNSRLSPERRLKTYRHELRHIKGLDFEKEYDADSLEKIAHLGKE